MSKIAPAPAPVSSSSSLGNRSTPIAPAPSHSTRAIQPAVRSRIAIAPSPAPSPISAQSRHAASKSLGRPLQAARPTSQRVAPAPPSPATPSQPIKIAVRPSSASIARPVDSATSIRPTSTEDGSASSSLGSSSSSRDTPVTPNDAGDHIARRSSAAVEDDEEEEDLDEDDDYDAELTITDAVIKRTLQPSKAWVLPARAKPGRKPSDDEPPTKRKAQNRASQRAFRERKQNYITSLEAKVAAYEAEGVEHAVELQRVAKRMKEDNDALRRHNTELRGRVDVLERQIKALLDQKGKSSSTTSTIGCKAPEHESGASSVRLKRPLPGRSAAGNSAVDRNAGRAVSVLGSDALFTNRPRSDSRSSIVSHQGRPSPSASCSTLTALTSRGPSDSVANASSKDVRVTPASATPLPPPSESVTASVGLNRDCGFCADNGPCPCSDDVLDLTGDDEEDFAQAKQEAHGDEVPSMDVDVPNCSSGPSVTIKQEPIEENEPRMPEAATSVRRPQAISVSSMLSSTSVGARRSAKLWPTTPAYSSGQSPAAVAAPLALRAAPPKPRLWTTTSSAAHPPTGTSFFPAPPSVSRTSTAAAASPVFRLRTGSASQAFSNVCSGDPANCGACSTDPALAAFCEAVSQNAMTPSGAELGTVVLDAGNSVPLRNMRSTHVAANVLPISSKQQRSVLWHTVSGSLVPKHSEGRNTTALNHGNHALPGGPRSAPLPSHRAHSHNAALGQQSIPEAWNQIRSHPRFQSWGGGLALLADVVSGRASGARANEPSQQSTSGLSTNTRPDNTRRASRYHPSNDRGVRHPSVEIEQADRSSSSIRSLVRGPESSTRGEESSSRPRLSPQSPTSPTSPSNAISSTDDRRSALSTPLRLAAPDTTTPPERSEGNPTEKARERSVEEDNEERVKRRRLWVDSDRVEQALAMLDRAGGQTTPAATSSETAAEAASAACPCPWSR
ncbi:hypothetical protein CBOM_05007 [Ceraceosorus bombacis]|uniref:BZIP domain-containing protein n=1 Tax=Ceraceosorus bombacis TaxID=401625 RepID=A0A0P1BIW0_9BASI|nr:hypothetical protein CBOM_05007 [Ceraceosorus bombacis]